MITVSDRVYHDIGYGQKATAREASERLNENISSVRSALRGLWKGGVLAREKQGAGYVYEGKQHRIE